MGNTKNSNKNTTGIVAVMDAAAVVVPKAKPIINAAKGVAPIVVPVIDLAKVVAPKAKPAFDTVVHYVSKTIEERKKLVAVPELYLKGYPLTKEQAVDVLNSCGFKAIFVKANLSEANAKYRNCLDMQVIGSTPKAKHKVKPGSTVYVKYITQEVIDESQRMYELAEKQKAEDKIAKAAKQGQRKEKAQRIMTGARNNAKKGIEKVSVLKKKDVANNEVSE